MRWRVLLVVCGWVVGNACAHAEHAVDPQTDLASPDYYVYADVIGVEPLTRIRTITSPRESCGIADPVVAHSHAYNHYDVHQARPNPIATLLGGVIGGLIGNQFGDGRGRTALTVAGAMAGAGIARHASAHRHDGYIAPHSRRYCETTMETREVSEVVGYRVRYRYAGHEFEKRVAEHPGERVRVAVRVTPAEPV